MRETDRSFRWMNWLFWSLVAMGLVPLAWFTYLPASDGPQS